MNKTVIDIGYGDLDLYVDGQIVLHIGQVSDDNTINLFLYPEGDLIESIMSEEEPTSRCTHEMLIDRVKPVKEEVTDGKPNILR